MSTAATGSHTAADRHPAQNLALALGVIYLLIGILGFFLTGFNNFASDSDARILGIFEVNPLHNIVHILIGAIGLALWKTRDGTRTYGTILAAVYGLTFLYGILEVQTGGLELLSLNWADNILHLLTALAGAGIVMWLNKDRDTRTGLTT